MYASFKDKLHMLTQPLTDLGSMRLLILTYWFMAPNVASIKPADEITNSTGNIINISTTYLDKIILFYLKLQ